MRFLGVRFTTSVGRPLQIISQKVKPHRWLCDLGPVTEAALYFDFDPGDGNLVLTVGEKLNFGPHGLILACCVWAIIGTLLFASFSPDLILLA